MAFETGNKKLLFLVSLILVFSLVFPVGAQTDICNIDTEILNQTSLNVKAQSYKIVEVDFDHTFNTEYITLLKNLKEINYFFHNEREFRIFDFKAVSENKIIYFNPKPEIKVTELEYVVNITIPTEGLKSLEVTYWADNVFQNKRDKWYLFEFGSEHWYPYDEYSMFLNNLEIESGMSVTKKFCFPEVDSDLNLSARTAPHIQVGSGPSAPIFVVHAPPRIFGTGNVRMIGPLTYPIDGNFQGLQINVYNYKTLEKITEGKTVGTVSYDVDVSFKRGQRSKWIFWIIFLYLTFAPWYVVRKSHNNNFWEKISEVYVTYSILPWLFSEITTTITPPTRPLTITLFDLTILWPFVLISIWWALGTKERGISKVKDIFKRRD
ncbi:MAG TPA: hypothetical protein ENH51_04480 [Euryarchaeota archaeon]|nr:hypothetical protein [Euryarchaeota archaeon]